MGAGSKLSKTRSTLSRSTSPFNSQVGQTASPRPSSKAASIPSDALALNPDATVPLLVDGDLTLPETGVILGHPGEKTGRLLPTEPIARAHTFEWLIFQLSAIGPTFGQSGDWQKLASDRDVPAIAGMMSKPTGWPI
jgi:glutathione S-transferase